jgi:biopolymer transport protein ExbB
MSSNQKSAGGFSSLVSSIVIALTLVLGFLVYKYIFGDESNFIKGSGLEGQSDNTGEPIEGNFLAIVYKGGIIVPFLLAVNFIVIIFSVERFVSLAKAKGKGNINNFVVKIKDLLGNNELAVAKEECDVQRGSLANVVLAGLTKYENIKNENELSKEQKIESLKAELEEATALELPMLSKNLVILSTCASIATLIGLIGTVMGMIKSFAAMSAGTPDTAKLATGISEALINTALGIFASTIAIIFFNLFSTKVDQLTHSMDEASFTIVQDFTASTAK